MCTLEAVQWRVLSLLASRTGLPSLLRPPLLSGAQPLCLLPPRDSDEEGRRRLAAILLADGRLSSGPCQCHPIFAGGLSPLFITPCCSSVMPALPPSPQDVASLSKDQTPPVESYSTLAPCGGSSRVSIESYSSSSFFQACIAVLLPFQNLADSLCHEFMCLVSNPSPPGAASSAEEGCRFFWVL